jgi:hypothetical protein
MENSGGPKPERNLEKDRQSFIEAVSMHSIEEISIMFDELAVQRLTDNLESNKVFILGEMHGVKENVDVIYTLFKKFGFRQLALEWEPELKKVAEKFLETGELDFNAIHDSQDGRITAGHFALLKKLKSEGVLEGIICFDGGSGGEGWNARDAAMAKNILTNLNEMRTLVVAGNLHAKTEPMNFDDEPGEQHPMGENIRKEIPEVASGGIEYSKGQYYNYGIQEFSELPQRAGSQETRFYQNEEGVYVFEVAEAHVATVPNFPERI